MFLSRSPPIHAFTVRPLKRHYGATNAHLVSSLIAHFENVKGSPEGSLESSSTKAEYALQKRFVETYDPKEPDFDFEPTRPSEVLYGNLEALKNRLHLFQLMKLQEQIHLDTPTLRPFSTEPFDLPTLYPSRSAKVSAQVQEIKEKKEQYYLRFEKFISVIGGLKDYVEPRDAFLSVTFYPKSLIWTVPSSVLRNYGAPGSLSGEGIIPVSSLRTNDNSKVDSQHPNLESFQLNSTQLHKFLLLCRESYDSTTGVVTLLGDRFPFVELNRQYLYDVLLSLLKESLVNFS